MDFKKNYHKEDKEFWDRIHEEEEQRKAELSEEELAAEEVQLHLEADEMIERIIAKQKNTIHIVNPKRVERFREMVSIADRLAQMQSLDIHAWTADKHGKIKLSGENLIVTYNTPEEDRLGIGKLFYYAEDAFMSVKEGKLDIEFVFQLCETM